MVFALSINRSTQSILSNGLSKAVRDSSAVRCSLVYTPLTQKFAKLQPSSSLATVKSVPSISPTMFFPFCFIPRSFSPKDYRQCQLKTLKAMRDSLETRMAALNAAIETMERQQVSQANTTPQQPASESAETA